MNHAGRSDEQRVKEVRFRKELRERKLRDGTTDRFWCVVDRVQNGFIVLRVCVSYPGSELLAGAYTLKLNSRESSSLQQESPCPCMVTSGGYVYRHHVPGCPSSSPVVAGDNGIELIGYACWAAHEKWRELHHNAGLVPVGAINACIYSYLEVISQPLIKDVRGK